MKIFLTEMTKNGKKYAIIDCGTGVGKSAIGLTIGDFINKNSSSYPGLYQDGSYFLTTQKVLQDQYENDFFSKGLISLYSSSNYTCNVDGKASCKDIQTGLRSKSLSKKIFSSLNSIGYNKIEQIDKKVPNGNARLLSNPL